ncbi:MAG: hypothetical protein A3G75_13720 [Verrucomicrobia bacterium RIFCSPLOWO2_12_FULL_64_8]|nr:MAG: hypothetical protein A3G75_13720 [Verrucomicrobia bacterium RIFCSPLOWO2_12_FULL_64_8]
MLNREKHDANYEDLYAASRHLLDDETGESINPLLADALTKIKAASSHLHVDQEYHIDKNPFASLVDRASDLVQWSVYHGLATLKGPVDLKIVSDVMQHTSETNVFSLNHDLLIEAQANAAGINVLDGFGEPNGDTRIFNGGWRLEERVVRLLKLHGSINWFLYRFVEWDQFARVDGDPYHARDAAGKLVDPLHVLPRFLTGTTVKEQAYGIPPFGDLFATFRALLSRHCTLICSGYGWGDKGINTRLRQWLRDAKENRIVILHHGPEERVAHTRMWWARWNDYRTAGKVVFIPKWLSECTLDDLNRYFDP